MNEKIANVIEELSDYIIEIRERGTGQERELLPELVNSLANLKCTLPPKEVQSSGKKISQNIANPYLD